MQFFDSSQTVSICFIGDLDNTSTYAVPRLAGSHVAKIAIASSLVMTGAHGSSVLFPSVSPCCAVLPVPGCGQNRTALFGGTLTLDNIIAMGGASLGVSHAGGYALLANA